METRKDGKRVAVLHYVRLGRKRFRYYLSSKGLNGSSLMMDRTRNNVRDELCIYSAKTAGRGMALIVQAIDINFNQPHDVRDFRVTSA